jgi:AbrB family looped-hinge helix DNA binding protein
MSTTNVTLDKAGRVVIPKSLRDELHLNAGDELRLKSEGDRLTLRPARSASPLRREHGVWVFRSGARVSAAATNPALQDVWDRRERNHRPARP